MGKTIRRILIALIASLGIGSAFTLSSCKKTRVCGSNDLVATPITDSFAFADEDKISRDNFVDATSGLAISEVVVSAYTDGDTTNFRPKSGTTEDKFRCRYMGVNTPESTGHIEEWGLKASAFTKKKLKGAESIVVINDITQYGKIEGSAGRLLGFVWYKTKGESSYRLLNLELVEQGYSKNTLQSDSEILVGYEEAFRKANDASSKAKLRVFGSADCDFDSSGDVVETTIANAKENFDEYGVDYETASGGRKLRVTGIVVGISGTDFYVRDVVKPDDAEINAGIYAFTQYHSAEVGIGYVVRFYCKITKYGGNLQLTDVETNMAASRYAFEVLSKDQAGCEALGFDYDINPIAFEPTSIKQNSDFDKYTGNLVEAILDTPSDNIVKVSTTAAKKTVYTIKTTCNGFRLNIRLSEHSFFSNEATINAVFKPSKKYKVRAFVDLYQFDEESDIEYQLSLPSFSSGLARYVSEVTE